VEDVRIVDTNLGNVHHFGTCGYKNPQKPGFPQKYGWLQNRFKEGLKMKTLYSEKDGAQGMIEYIPGEYCWRPVEAPGYMFIHCIFLGFKKEYKGRGYGSRLLSICQQDARDSGMAGVVVVTRKGSFMADSHLFLKHRYRVADTSPPDFELLVKKFSDRATGPRFPAGLGEREKKYSRGLTILRADQCPYTVKNVTEILAVAQQEFGITPLVVDLKNYEEAQAAPNPFGTFCIIHDGEIVAHHPVSAGRFRNIMNQRHES